MTEHQVRHYLQQVLRGRPVAEQEAWAEVIDHLDVVAGLLSTPWRLHLATTVYAGGYDPRGLLVCPDVDAMDRILLPRLIPVAVAAHPAPGYDAAAAVRWLTALSGAGRSAGPPQEDVGGAADMVLHRLPPYQGSRLPERCQYILTVLGGLAVITPLAVQILRIDSSASQVAGVVVLVLVNLLGSGLSRFPGMQPLRMVSHRRRVRITRDRLREWCAGLLPDLLHLLFLCGLPSLVMLVTTLSLSFGSDFVSDKERVELVAVWLGLGLGSPLTYGIVCLAALASATWFGSAESQPVLHPGAPLRHDLVLTAVVMALTVPWAFLPPGPATLLSAVAVYFAGGRPWLRYGITLLQYRRHRLLPLRLVRFLHWAHRAGLLRVAGPAYQFRHAELRNWLADGVREPGARPGRSTG
ncbi:hypothetical protein [Streptomyces sp. CA2R106]|uniref:hypothetical protein n=1 Tax=Streptomyces sp. CA2R106 TaxID=3120153 RepID=UPI003008C34D